MRFCTRWVRQESAMLITDIRRNKGNNLGHVGLALIGEMARVCGLDTLADRLGAWKSSADQATRNFPVLRRLIWNLPTSISLSSPTLGGLPCKLKKSLPWASASRRLGKLCANVLIPTMRQPSSTWRSVPTAERCIHVPSAEPRVRFMTSGIHGQNLNFYQHHCYLTPDYRGSIALNMESDVSKPHGREKVAVYPAFPASCSLVRVMPARGYRNVENFITMVYLIAAPIQVVVAS